MTLTFVRRRNLGRASIRSMSSHLGTEHGVHSTVLRTWLPRDMRRDDHTAVLLRWGCTSTLPPHLSTGIRVLNSASAIHRANDKSTFAATLSSSGIGPRVVSPLDSSGLMETETYVVRPLRHSQGRHLSVLNHNSLTSLLSNTSDTNWYARPLIKKVAEFRVYVLFGKVASVAQKLVTDTSQVAWNHAVGAEFVNVKWDEWNTEVCFRALIAANLSKLDYAAVDVMVEEHTLTPWIIEVNSAGSLPPNEDGTPSYRARCVADCLAWHMKELNFDHFTDDVGVEGWRRYIHPAVWSNHPLNGGNQVPLFVSTRSP